jgi:spermidine synthase
MSTSSSGFIRALQIAVFSLTIFVSAFLLFQVQPMVSKAILPWFGGGPAVWTAAMLFFQCALFGGYLYAHSLASIQSARRQALIHVTLLACAALLAQSVIPHAGLRPEGVRSPVSQILWILTLSVGLPYFCLASTGPLLQHWFARARVGRAVYRLFALSNLGSLLALLSFPYLFEPWFELPVIGAGWTWGFWLFALGCGAVALFQAREVESHQQAELMYSRALQQGSATSAPNPQAEMTSGGAPTALPSQGRGSLPSAAQQSPASKAKEVAAWILLPALASMLFIATTDQASHNIAPEPRLWILTLSIYLLSFIVSFDHSRWYRPGLVAALGLFAVLFVAGRHVIPGFFDWGWSYGATELRYLFAIMLFLVCLVCHGELYRRRPSDSSRLTAYYLWMSFGGACGGLFIALIATHLFNDFHEWPIGLAAAAALCVQVVSREIRLRRAGASDHASQRKAGLGLPTGVALVLCAGLAFWWDNPIRARVTSASGVNEVALDQSRNFYGVVAVVERKYPAEPSRDHRVFYSGQITHGIQMISPGIEQKPVSYYDGKSGIGETLEYLKSKNPSIDVAVTGLGAGTVAAYARPTDRYDFFEINPEAERIARGYFSFLSGSAARELRVIIGDARLSFAQLPEDKRYDLILLAAFSGGSVPVHLLTREAFEAYAAHLKPGGFLVVNITNAYLNLYPVVKRQAEVLGLTVRSKFQEKEPERFIRENHYMILTKDAGYIAAYPSVDRPIRDAQGKIVGTTQYDIPGVGLWTDNFSSITPLEWR